MSPFVYVIQLVCISAFLVYHFHIISKRAKELSEAIQEAEKERQKRFYEMERALWRALEGYNRAFQSCKRETEAELQAIRRDLPSIPN